VENTDYTASVGDSPEKRMVSFDVDTGIQIQNDPASRSNLEHTLKLKKKNT